MATRIQSKSREAKKVMVDGGKIIARTPKIDKRGYPDTDGTPSPVLVSSGAAPEPEPEPEPEAEPES